MFFIGVIVQPLFNVLTRLDNVDIDVAMDHLRDNQAKMKQIIVDFDEAEKQKSGEGEREGEKAANGAPTGDGGAGAGT